MIRCPHSGQDVGTGIDTDQESLRKIPDTLHYTPCPYCGFDHAWWKNEAWLAEEHIARRIGKAKMRRLGACNYPAITRKAQAIR